MKDIVSFLNKLSYVKSVGKNQWTADCPCPSHKTPAKHLSVKLDDNKILINCFRSDTAEDIVKAMGLELTDLFLDEPEAPHSQAKIVTEYSYHDEDGKELYQVVRYEPKDFRQRHSDGNGGYIWNLEGIRRVLYHLDELLIIPPDETVYVVEGEKDADNLWAWGQRATTSPGGAGAWQNEYAQYLTGRNICMIPDKDLPGLNYTLAVIKSLEGKAELSVVILPDAHDISDWLAAGNDVEELPKMAVTVSAFMGYVNIYKTIYVRDTDNLGINGTKNGTTGQDSGTPLAERIREWVSETSGWFLTEELDRDLGISNQSDKENRRKALLRLEESGVIERHEKQNKCWRFVNKELIELNYKQLAVTTPLPIVMPLGISNLVNLHAGNLVVLAGTTNAGKTAMALEIIKLNNNSPMPAYYFYSEGGANELRDRLDKCEGMAIEEWNFRLFSRSTNFADVIAPDCLNVVDYLEMTGDFWEVNKHLTDICNKIGSGLAVVCIQKKKDAIFARGGEFSAEKARLYVALDEAEGRNCAKALIVKGKSWAVKGYNPNKLEATFEIENGWIKGLVTDWHYSEAK